MRNYCGSNYTATPPTATSRPCSSCGGTGFYCMGVENGRPYSRTGFNCFRCDGSGWVTPKARRVRCPRCKCLVTKEQSENGHTLNYVSNGTQTISECI